MISNIRRFWQSVPARITGSHVDVGAEHVTHLSSKAPIPADSRLEQRLKEANRKPLPKVERKTPESEFLQKLRAAAQRSLIEENPDTWVKPIDYDEDGLPNG